MSNQRQIPKAKEILSNKLYWDIVYGYIQVNSVWDEQEGHPRILPKKLANFSKIGELLGLSRQTVAKRFKDLENGQKNDGNGLKLIKQLKNGDYEITILDNEIATLIDNDTLRILTSAMNDHTISIYVYLYSRWKANQEQEFTFTYEQLKKVIGIGHESTSNNYIIKDIIDVLELIGLLRKELVTVLSDNGGYKNNYKVTWMGDKIVSVEEKEKILVEKRVKNLDK